MCEAECYQGAMPSDRDHGPQPIARLMHERGLTAADLVAASNEQLTFKAVARALQGRWLTPNMRGKVRRAVVKASGTECALAELFTYADADSSSR
jgi:hypothetical protein